MMGLACELIFPYCIKQNKGDLQLREMAKWVATFNKLHWYHKTTVTCMHVKNGLSRNLHENLVGLLQDTILLLHAHTQRHIPTAYNHAIPALTMSHKCNRNLPNDALTTKLNEALKVQNPRHRASFPYYVCMGKPLSQMHWTIHCMSNFVSMRRGLMTKTLSSYACL